MEVSEKTDTYAKEDKEGPLSFILNLLLYVGIALFIRFFILNITLVEGSSMLPNFQDGDRLITQKVSLYFNPPSQGDVVVIKAPDNPSKNYIKRVIALGGDQVELLEGQLYINGQLREEDFIAGAQTNASIQGHSQWTIPEGYIFVLGDNRGGSNDSRNFGPVDEKDVVGISVFRIYPLNRFGSIK